MKKCYECKEQKGYYAMHDQKPYCMDCYGKHTPEVPMKMNSFTVDCPFCNHILMLTPSSIPDRCQCGALISTHGVKKGHVRFLKW